MAALTATANPTTWTKYNSYVDKTAARTFTCVNQLQINQGQGYCATLAKVVAFVLCAIPLLCVVPVVALWRWVAGTTPPTTQPAVTQPPPQPPRPLPNPAPPAPAVDAPSVETQQLVAAVAQLSATVGGLTHPANRPPEPTPPRVQEIAETMVRGSIAQWRAHPNAENAEALLRFNVDPNISLPTDLQREFDACKAEARATQAGAGLAASAAAASAARNVLTTEELQRFAGDPATIPWREALRGAFQESQGEMTEEKVRAVVAEWTTDALKASMLLVCAANNREKYPALSRDLLYASGAAEERVAHYFSQEAGSTTMDAVRGQREIFNQSQTTEEAIDVLRTVCRLNHQDNFLSREDTDYVAGAVDKALEVLWRDATPLSMALIKIAETKLRERPDLADLWSVLTNRRLGHHATEVIRKFDQLRETALSADQGRSLLDAAYALFEDFRPLSYPASLLADLRRAKNQATTVIKDHLGAQLTALKQDPNVYQKWRDQQAQLNRTSSRQELIAAYLLALALPPEYEQETRSARCALERTLENDLLRILQQLPGAAAAAPTEAAQRPKPRPRGRERDV